MRNRMLLVGRIGCGNSQGSSKTNFARPSHHTSRLGGQCPCPGSHSKLVSDEGPVLRAPASQPGLSPGSLKSQMKPQTPTSGRGVVVEAVFGKSEQPAGQEDSWAGRGSFHRGPPAVSTSATRWRPIPAYLTTGPGGSQQTLFLG